MSFGNRLKELRNKKGLTQEELGKIIKQTKANISKYENGKLQPSIETINTLASFFNVTTDYLLGNDTPPKDECDEVNELLEHLHKRPELKVLFSTTKNAKKEDIEKAVSYIEFLKKQSEGDWDE